MPVNPLLFQVNTRVWLRELGASLGRPATLDDVPDAALAAWRAQGFDWVWFLGVWRIGAAGRAVLRGHADWQAGFRQVLPDLTDADITGSCFAIVDYALDPVLGDDGALVRLRARLREHGLKLMLDFVPNHMAPDHPWLEAHPERFVTGSPADLAAAPQNWMRIGQRVIAHGRDPYFPGWPDTVQLDYARPETVAAMRDVLAGIAACCDGVRCDMAMLVLPEVFERTWGRRALPFWQEAIAASRQVEPGFVLMAEVYWGLEDRLLGLGFDYAYDKSLYDTLLHDEAGGVRAALAQDETRQTHLARFLENHDEPRAAAVFPAGRLQAAAVLAFCAPGLRFLHQKQIEGARVHIPVHLDRGPVEPVDGGLRDFYLRLLAALGQPALRAGRHVPLAPRSAWDGNGSWQGFVAFLWMDGQGRPSILGVVNFAQDRGQCRLTVEGLAGAVELRDLLGEERYRRDGAAMADEGLFIDQGAWGHNLFVLSPSGP